MKNEINFQTYIYLGPEKFSIVVFDRISKKKFFNDEYLIKNQDYNQINFELFENFLEKNIFQIEKLTCGFIDSVIFIVENNQSLPIDISLKINNDENLVDNKNIQYSLIDAKQQITKYYINKRIVHIIIESYNLDNIKYSFLSENINCKNLSIDIKFICFPKKLTEKLELLLQKNQIFIKKFMCAKYLNSFFNDKSVDINEMALRINEGCNKKEITLVPKIPEKKGFFEKFFHFFS